ncbi:hypothetical protein EUX98_g4797 [Antrodiella citrinella]|uniref:Peptidase A1 domain-containing protein n=1 Tax=Antrodiella citrinella TaxID=2447956 RepID=A0A4S4MT70_9APHY|nr:hypothetical protein EUX98_g4797 [Antrodiella citrinella]
MIRRLALANSHAVALSRRVPDVSNSPLKLNHDDLNDLNDLDDLDDLDSDRRTMTESVSTRRSVVDREKTAPFLIRAFLKIGNFHRLSQFEDGNLPTADEQQIFTWKDATLREVLTSLRDIAPHTTEYRHPLARYAFRAIYADAANRGACAQKELGLIYSRDILGEPGTLTAAAPRLLRDDEELLGLAAAGDAEDGDKAREERTLEELRFVPGDYLCVMVVLPKSIAVPTGPAGELSIKGAVVAANGANARGRGDGGWGGSLAASSATFGAACHEGGEVGGEAKLGHETDEYLLRGEIHLPDEVVGATEGVIDGRTPGPEAQDERVRGTIETKFRHPVPLPAIYAMGVIYSTVKYINARKRKAKDLITQQQLHKLVRPARYPSGSDRPSFYSAYARAARRYGFETGKYAGFAKRENKVVKVKSLNDKSTKHEVPAEGIQNEYVVQVKIGTPGVTLNLDFDTGSSDLWVWSSEFAGAASHKDHTIFDPRRSKTARKTPSTWAISYGDGSSASGDVYIDAVSVAGVTIPNQAVELASKLSDSFLQDGGNDGLLGLAWPSINTVQPRSVATPVQNMINQKLVKLPVFTAKLTRGNEAGFYSFGFIDETVTSDPIKYTEVDNSQGFWQVASASYSINGQEIARNGNTAILDTGTTLALVSDEVVEAIYTQINGATYDNEQGGWKFPSNATIPEVAFAVGGTSYTINPKDFAFGSADEGYAFGGIQSRGDLNFDIFGDVFLKNVYVVFNQGEKKVGLAQRDD